MAEKDPYFKTVQRGNVLLLGDMISDLKMASFAPNNNILKIGFCNYDDNEETYLNHFDVVLKGNPGFDTVNTVLKSIV